MLKNKSKLAYLLLFVFVIAFVIITLKGLKTAQPGDENVYYYMGKLVSEGKLPYKDFFYAHPPLHIYFISIIYKLFGFNIIALKLVPLISTLISAFFIFKITKEKFGNSEAIASSLLFLFSYSVLFNSVFSFGVDLALVFLTAGFYFLWIKDRYILSGVLFGLAAMTRLLSLIPIVTILAIVLLHDRKKFFKMSSAFLAVFLLFNIIFIMFSGYSYIEQVYKYHLLKKTDAGKNFNEYFEIIKLNWILFASALSIVFVKEKQYVKIPILVSIIYLIFLLSLKRLFGFYFIVVFPFLAIIGGYSIIKIFDWLRSKKLYIPSAVLLLLVFSWNLASDVMFLEKIGFTGFERSKDLIDFVNSNSDENTLLFGDDSVVPLLALYTNKPIAMDFVDMNEQVFVSGLRDINEILSSLNGKNVLFIARSRQGISSLNEVRLFLNNNCEFLSQFADKIEGNYLVYRCI